MHEKSPAEIDVLLIGGLQGSGKSSLTLDAFSDRRRVNRDEIRAFHKQMTTGTAWKPSDWHPSVEPLVTAIENEVLRHELRQGRPVVIDNTLIDRRLRAPYIALAKEVGRSVGCLFLSMPLELCLERNRRRDRQVPEDILREFHASIELPSAAEGLDLIQILTQPVTRGPAAASLTVSEAASITHGLPHFRVPRGGLS